MSIPAHRKFSISTDRTYEDLFKICKSLYNVLKDRECGPYNTDMKEKRVFNMSVRTHIRDLRANVLYKAGRHIGFEKYLETLHRKTNDTRSIFFDIEKRTLIEMEEHLRKHFDTLDIKILWEIESRGEDARLGKLLLKPFLMERQDSDSDVQVEGNVAGTGEVAPLGEADLKRLSKEKTVEDFWDQFVIEDSSEASS